MTRSAFALCLAVVSLVATPAIAGPADFTKGPVITQHGGAIASVAVDVPLDTTIDYKVIFDVDSSEAGKLNRNIDSAARLINMLAANGVPISRIHPVLVVHGPGIGDILNDQTYATTYPGKTNPNAALVRELMANGVSVYVCGQTAALYDAKKDNLIPGVKMTLSAMTTIAALQRQGYTQNF